MKGQRLLRFTAGAVSLGLPVDQVREVVRVRELSRVPGASPSVVGVMSFRGSILGVIDAGLRLGARPCDRASSNARVLALETPSHGFGILCDEVAGFEWIMPTELAEAPADLSERHGSCVVGVFDGRGQRALLIDAGRILERP